jgi:acyl carrier protein
VVGAARQRAGLRRTLFEEWFRGVLSRVLAPPLHGVTADTPIDTIGIDSIGAVQIQQVLERDLGLHIALTSFFDDRTLGQIIDSLVEALPNSLPATPASPIQDDTNQQHAADNTALTTASWGERAIWYLHEQNPTGHWLNLAFEMRPHHTPHRCGLLVAGAHGRSARVCVSQRRRTAATNHARAGFG